MASEDGDNGDNDNGDFDWSLGGPDISYDEYDGESTVSYFLRDANKKHREFMKICEEMLVDYSKDKLYSIYDILFELHYGANGVWVVPTLKSIHFILHLMRKYQVSRVIAVGVGNGLIERILLHEASREGVPISLFASDDNNEYRKPTDSGIGPNGCKTYSGKYLSSIEIMSATFSIKYIVSVPEYIPTHQSISTSQPIIDDTIFIMWARARKYSVNVLNLLQREVYASYNVVICAYTTGEECVNTLHQCEPKEFFDLARGYGYIMTKYDGPDTVLFSHPEQYRFDAGTPDYLLVLERRPIER